MSAQHKDYRRQLAEAALARAGRACTSGEVHEIMGQLAMDEGHPVAAWRGITPQQVAGALRAMEEDGESVRAGERNTGKRARPDPLWVAGPEACRDIPSPPDSGDPDPDPEEVPRAPNLPRTVGVALRTSVVPPKEELDQFTPAQLRVMLDVNDELLGVVGRFMHDLRDYTARARRRLEEVGIEATPR